VLIVVALLAGGVLIAWLPIPVLAAIAPVGAVKLLDVTGLWRLWRGWRSEAVIALLTAVGVAVLGVLWGLVVAVAFALAELIGRAARPQDAVRAITGPDQSPQEIDPQRVASIRRR